MRRGLLAALALTLAAGDARAELVHLRSGRTLSVRTIAEQGSRVVLGLRGGGEIECDRALILQVTPDEVPYPEPAAQPHDGDPAAGIPRLSGRPGFTGFPGIPGIPGINDVPGETLNVPPRYQGFIDRSSTAHGVDARLVGAVITVESGFQTRARSRKGAMGLMQLMPDTARRYAVRRPYDPAANIDAGTRHLRSLLDRFPLDLALAAYNAGEATIERFQGIPPYPETRDYVTRILKLIGTSADKQ